ncbi:MAG: HEAT repeat domain-containing protein [Actinomycetota bacterium]|nr:HEAT repeat domain-containing protein [Actinomycetota bacterium]
MAGHEGDERLVRRLWADPDPAIRATALGALARMGSLDAATLADAVADPSPVVRRRAAALAVASPDISLLALLDDPDPGVIEQAAWACGERSTTEGAVVEALSRLATGHDDALCREAAVAALGAIGDEAGLAAVLACTTDRATVRRRAVIALAAFEGPDVDAALRRATTDRDWQVRQAAEDQLDDPDPHPAAGLPPDV